MMIFVFLWILINYICVLVNKVGIEGYEILFESFRSCFFILLFNNIYIEVLLLFLIVGNNV